MSPAVSMATTFRRAGRFRSRSFVRKIPSKMNSGTAELRNYLARLAASLRYSLVQLTRAPSHSKRREAARELARQTLLLTALLGATIVALMVALDAPEIASMPPRGTPALWPV